MSPPTQPPPGRRGSATAPGPQERVAALRANLLGGRGPGASPAEMEAHQHQRVDYGGVPVTADREQLALATQKARDATVDQTQERASARLAHPGDQPPRPPRHQRADIVAALAVGAVLGFTAARLRRRRKR